MGSIKFNTNRTKVELTGITETESSTLSGKGKQTSVLPTYKPKPKEAPPPTMVGGFGSPATEIGKRYGSGNINLLNRPRVKNIDGSISTVRSMSFSDGKNEILIPTISDDGRTMTEKEAIAQYKKTGKYLGKFKDVKSANAYAEKLSQEQAKIYVRPEIDLPNRDPFTQEEVMLLQHQSRIPMAMPKSDLRDKAAINTEYALKSNPSMYGRMEGFSPLATKKQVGKMLGQEIDTTGAEDTLGYKVGYGAGLMGQYMITGGIAHTGVRQGLTRMIPQLANQAGRSTVKNVLGTMGASALTDVLTGVPVNTLQAIKESTIGDNVNWNQFAKSFAVNTGIDIVFGGLIEGAIVLKSGKKVTTVADMKMLTGTEAKEFTEAVTERLMLPKPKRSLMLGEPMGESQMINPDTIIAGDRMVGKKINPSTGQTVADFSRGVGIEGEPLTFRKPLSATSPELIRGTMPTQAKTPLKQAETKLPTKVAKAEPKVTTAKPEGVFVDYYPEKRAIDVIKSTDYHQITKEANYKPDDYVTIYRGAPDVQTKITDGDWVSTSKQLAKDYAGTGKVIEDKIQAKHLYASKGEGIEELIYSTKATKIPTKPQSVEAEMKSLAAEMKKNPPTEAQVNRYKELKANVKALEPTNIPAKEPVKPVEPLKADKPTVAPKAKTMEPKATKTVDAKVDSMGGEKSFFNKIDDVTERNKAKEKLSEKIKFTNKEGRQVTKTRKDYIEDASSIYGSHIETIKRQTTDSPKSSTLYEYRLYKRPTSTKFTKLSKHEKEYFEYAKSKQPEMPKIFTEKTSFNKKPFKETPLTKQSPPKPKPKPDVSELVLTSAKESRKPRKERLYDAGLDTKRKMVDSGDTVAVISKITGDDSIYHAYNKARSASRIGEHMIGEAQVNIKGDVVGESLESIFKPIIDKGDGYYKEFVTYLLHKLNVDRMPQGKPVFGKHITADMSIREADRLLREYPEFEQLAEKVYKYNRNIMQYRIDAGLVTLDEANMWANMYPHYVPIARMEKSISKVAEHAKTQKTKKISKTVMEAVGDDTKIVPIHVSMSRQTMMVVKEAETNLFANRLVDSASVKTAKYLQDSTLMKKGVPLEDLIEGELPYLKNGFHLFRDGKVYEVKVDEGLFEAIQALSPSAKSPNIMNEGAMFVNKTFKQLVTSYSPPFLIKNFVRDVPDAMLYSIDSKEFIKQFPKAMKEIKTNGPLWQKYKAMGGMSSSFFDYAKGYKGDSSFIRRNTVDRIEHLNMLTEQLPRFTEFMVTLSKGDKSYDNFLEALFNSADVTVNFGKKGTWGKVINETAVPFFNPSIQGFDKAIRFFKNNKGAKRWAVVIKKAALLGIAPSVINEIVYGDDPSYQKLRNRDKDLHYIFKVGEDFWLRVPKGRVISVIGGVPQRTVRKIRGEENAYADFLKSSAEQIAPVSPLTSNLYSPIIHAETNKAWHGGAIVPYGLVNKAAGEQFDEGTTSMSKWLGGKLKYSPKKIDYLVDAYTGIIGDLAMPLMTKKADMHPFIKAFTIDGVTSNKISHTFYEKKTEVSQLKDEGDVVGYIQNRYLGKQASMVSKLFDEVTEIQLSNMSDTKKYTKVRELRALINGVQQNALDSLTEIEKATKKLERKYEDSDDLYREVNKEVFGAEYALEMYNKQLYEKAKEAVKASGLGKKVTYEQYYKGYFAQKDKPSDIGKAVALKSENIDTLFVAFDISDKNARIGAAIYENDLSYIYETTYKRIGENNATKSAEKIAIIRQHNPNLTRQQLNILYEAFNVAESIGGYRRQFK